MQCNPAFGEPADWGLEADGGQPEEGQPKDEAMEAQSAPVTVCPALPCLAWVRCVGKCLLTQEDAESSLGLRGTVTHRRPRGLEAGSQGPRSPSGKLEGWDRSADFGFAQCPV